MFYLVSALAYTVAALWVSRPLIAHFTSAIPMGTTPSGADVAFLSGDPHQLLFYCWLFAKNVTDGRFPFANDLEFAGANPSGVHLMGAWGFPLQPLWGLGAAAGLSAEAAYNALFLVSFPATGVVMAFCARRLGASRVAAFVAGLAYAFCVFRVVQATCGHANGFLLGTFPLVWLALWSWLGEARFWQRTAVAVGLGALLLFLACGEWHLFYYTTLLVGVFVATALVRHRGAGWRAAAIRVASLAPAGFLALCGLVWVRWVQKFGLDMSPVKAGRSAHEAEALTPLPFDFFVPWVRFTRDVVFSHELERRSHYVGLSLLVLIGLALHRRKRVETTALDGQARVLGWTVLVTLLLMFSPVLPPLYALLKVAVPYWAFVRVKGRLSFILMFAVALLAAWAIDKLRTTARPRLAAIAVAAALLDFVVISPSTLLSRGPLAHIAAPGGGPFLYLPYGAPNDAVGSAAQRLIMATGKPFVNGYEPVGPQAAFDAHAALADLNRGEVTDTVLEALDRHGVTHVVHDRDLFYGKRRLRLSIEGRDKLIASGYFELVAEDANVSLLAYHAKH
ncbi:MAG: hypothetical protein ACAI38_17140 [Myxococcota bacterium]